MFLLFIPAPFIYFQMKMLRERIKWVRIADSEDEIRARINGRDIHVFEVGMRRYAAAIRPNGELVVFRDRCPHQGYSFKGGVCGEDDRLVCPIHRYSFDCEKGQGAGLAVLIYLLKETEEGLMAGRKVMSLF